MASRHDDKDWRLYERIVAALEAENRGIDLTITPNATIVGSISNQRRQVDVLVDARWGDNVSKRIVIDAKLHRRKLDIKDVESFEGMIKDCNANRGILVCPNGWTEGAKRRAQDIIEIRLMSLNDLDVAGVWAAFSRCLGQCKTRTEEHRTGLVLWDGYHSLSTGGLVNIVATGKCDACHNFHVWCWDCGDQFALGDEDTYTCACEHLWATLIEEDAEHPLGETLNAVHLVVTIEEGSLIALDRRRLR